MAAQIFIWQRMAIQRGKRTHHQSLRRLMFREKRMHKPNSEPRKMGGLLSWMCDIADVNIWRGTLRTEATSLVPLNFHGWSVPWNLDDLGLPESEPKRAIWRRTPLKQSQWSANGCFQIHGASKMIHFWCWIFHETIQIYPAIGVPGYPHWCNRFLPRLIRTTCCWGSWWSSWTKRPCQRSFEDESSIQQACREKTPTAA